MQPTTAALVLLALAAISSPGSAQDGSSQELEPRAVARVVKLLQDMMEETKVGAAADRELYAKFKCYCDTNQEKKKASIGTLTRQIALLEADIEKLQGQNGELSAVVAKMKADMHANEAAQAEAEGLRNTSREAFVAEEADLTAAITQMTEALHVLTEIAGDQTLTKGGDHTQFLASINYTKVSNNIESKTQALLKLHAALSAASSFLGLKQQRSVQALLQTPFTDTYTARSVEVVGILKSMLDTFTSNLEAARTTEQAENAAFVALQASLKNAHDTMSEAYDAKQGTMGGNDSGLSENKQQLTAARDQKAEDEDFLAKLGPMCAEKERVYNKRRMFRENEQAAIAEAIAILNSDIAFRTFGSVHATSLGPTAFVQLRSIRRHSSFDGDSSVQRQVMAALDGRAVSARVLRVVALLQAGNPFAVVLKEIDKMLALILMEADADLKQRDWCVSEKASHNADLGQKNDEITALELSINGLRDEIHNPEAGLVKQISDSEDTLVTNRQQQVSMAEMRAKENQAYQKDSASLVDAKDLLQRAIKVLTKYYDALREQHNPTTGSELLQNDPTPPPLWQDGTAPYAGAGESGTSAISMLEFILENTKKEEHASHEAEATAQREYEDGMGGLKGEEHRLEESLVSLRATLAAKEKDLVQQEGDLKRTVGEKEAIGKYLEDIGPGCDFIESRYDARESHRQGEQTALENARGFIKGSPAYQKAEQKEFEESYGLNCKPKCVADPEDAACKACLADVTVAGYCAGHPGTKGCPSL